MQFYTRRSHTEQLRTYTEIRSVKEGNGTSFVSQFLKEVGLFIKDLAIRCCLLSGIATLLKNIEFPYAGFSNTFLQLLCPGTPDNTTY